MNKKILYTGLALIIIVAIVGIFLTDKGSNVQEYNVPSPEDVINQYFISWNNKNWPDMYAAISDGFKKIEPTAKDLASFRNYALSQDITGVDILSVKEKSNNGRTAEVDYSVDFILPGGTKKNFTGTFSLKYREADIIPGWKLIYPYGKNIDTS